MADPKSRPARATTPPASADAPEARQPADATFSLERWQDNPGAHNHDPHVLAGAASLAGWKPNTQLTKSELADGVRKFLTYKPNEE